MMEKSPIENDAVRRFSVFHRLLHIFVMISFTFLAVTGFSLSFSNQAWAQLVVSLLGGAESAAGFHRFCAALFYLVVVSHLIWLGYFKVVLKGRWTGPHTMIPNSTDWENILQNFRYIFGKGKPPLFNRFSYLEKVDYWAVLLGMQSMGVTGLLMWHPEAFSAVLPGYAINIANEFHFHEAILAVGYIGVVHMTSTHLTPEAFPLETSIFNGRIARRRLKAEHPGEWKDRYAPTATAEGTTDPADAAS